jgi:murein DD-endopeptidase MepM/ murein hydrolase activator NlpD
MNHRESTSHKIEILLLIGLIALLASVNPARAQTPSNPELEYVVQPNDTLLSIALAHNLRLTDMIVANQLSPLGFVFAGQKLVLPGVPAPTATPPPTPTPQPSPTPVVDIPLTETPHIVQPGETIYSIAEYYGVPMGSLVLVNSLLNPDHLESGQILQIPAADVPTPEAPAAPFAAVQLSEQEIIQGRTLVVNVQLSQPATLSGWFEGQPLFFSDGPAGEKWAITAVHALLQPNTYPVVINAALPNGETVTRVEPVTVLEGPYGFENIQLDNTRSSLLDAELLAAERKKLLNLWTNVSPQPRWTGPFWYPSGDPNITSYFGTRRTYNFSDEFSFHSGVDFGGAGTPIYAPAGGTVVLTEPLTVRGNAVVIDHGLGLYSGYWHQSQIAVQAGQIVNPGDLIGYVGSTGLVTGPHLHWELRLNGIAVNPLQWIRESIP